MGAGGIRLVLSDVDGTLLTSGKELTDATVDAVRAVHDAGIRFTVASSRPAQGVAMLIAPLAIDAPIGAFNGGVFVDGSLAVVDQLPLEVDVAARVIGMIDDAGVSPWLYTGTHWFVRDFDGPHVQHEARVTQYEPTATADLVGALDGRTGPPVKVVGFCEDHDRVAAAEAAITEALGARVSATRSQAYYVDVTHPDANKGAVVAYLSACLGIPTEAIATIGDGRNDTLMFAPAGTSIAMGNADDDVKALATHVTTTNDDDGFARAMHDIVLAP
ncbi:MAG: HAD family phosphatase [Actinobacteria bacterium]|nr:HAD family phosphatase [Actinomycetota bacterium]